MGYQIYQLLYFIWIRLTIWVWLFVFLFCCFYLSVCLFVCLLFCLFLSGFYGQLFLSIILILISVTFQIIDLQNEIKYGSLSHKDALERKVGETKYLPSSSSLFLWGTNCSYTGYQRFKKYFIYLFKYKIKQKNSIKIFYNFCVVSLI